MGGKKVALEYDANNSMVVPIFSKQIEALQNILHKPKIL